MVWTVSGHWPFIYQMYLKKNWNMPFVNLKGGPISLIIIIRCREMWMSNWNAWDKNTCRIQQTDRMKKRKCSELDRYLICQDISKLIFYQCLNNACTSDFWNWLGGNWKNFEAKNEPIVNMFDKLTQCIVKGSWLLSVVHGTHFIFSFQIQTNDTVAGTHEIVQYVCLEYIVHFLHQTHISSKCLPCVMTQLFSMDMPRTKVEFLERTSNRMPAFLWFFN